MSTPLRLDAHQHFWSVARGDYGWLTPDLPLLYQDYLPEDYQANLELAQLDGTILVQAAPTLAETEFLLSLAAETDFIKGVVGWIDFEAETVLSDLARLATDPKFVGVRPMIQDIEDPEWMLNPDFTPVFEALRTVNLTFDALVKPVHLPVLRQLLQRHPNLKVVLDHGGKPDIASGAYQIWQAQIQQLAAEHRLYCKLSGLITEADTGWQLSDLQPYMDHLKQCFGADRLMWGSDWPVCQLAGGFRDWYQATQTWCANQTEKEQVMIMGRTAQQAYGIKETDHG